MLTRTWSLSLLHPDSGPQWALILFYAGPWLLSSLGPGFCHHYHWLLPVHPKGDQSWVFIGRTDAEAETLIFWPPDAKSWLFGKDTDAWKDWGQEEKGMIEDKMVGWHHGLNGHGFGWTLGVGDGQGGLVHYGSWRRKESDTTERLNWTETKISVIFLRSKSTDIQ